MLILAADTSSTNGSLALIEQYQKEVKLLAYEEWQKSFSHSEQITLVSEKLFTKARKKLSDLDALACGIGPGSFTGIRISLSFVKSLAFFLQKPIYSVSSLQLLAQGCVGQKLPVLVMIPAFGKLFYSASYSADGQSEIMAPRAITLDQLPALIRAPHYCRGIGFKKPSDLWTSEFKRNMIYEPNRGDELSAKAFVELLAADTSAKIPKVAWKNLNPLYIRASEAEEKLRSGLLKPLPKLNI